MKINLISLTKELAALLSKQGQNIPNNLKEKIFKTMGTLDPEVINTVALAWNSVELTPKETLEEAAKLKSLIFDLRNLKYSVVG